MYKCNNCNLLQAKIDKLEKKIKKYQEEQKARDDAV